VPCYHVLLVDSLNCCIQYCRWSFATVNIAHRFYHKLLLLSIVSVRVVTSDYYFKHMCRALAFEAFVSAYWNTCFFVALNKEMFCCPVQKEALNRVYMRAFDCLRRRTEFHGECFSFGEWIITEPERNTFLNLNFAANYFGCDDAVTMSWKSMAGLGSNKQLFLLWHYRFTDLQVKPFTGEAISQKVWLLFLPWHYITWVRNIRGSYAT